MAGIIAGLTWHRSNRQPRLAADDPAAVERKQNEAELESGLVEALAYYGAVVYHGGPSSQGKVFCGPVPCRQDRFWSLPVRAAEDCEWPVVAPAAAPPSQIDLTNGNVAGYISDNVHSR